MKAGIVTFNRAYNNGAILQCYALCKALHKNGIEAKVIDYYPVFFKQLYNIEKKFKLTHPPIKTWINHFILRDILAKRNENYEQFIEKYLDKTDTYYSKEELEKNCPGFDIYIAGSDQVWNFGCTEFDPVYFLDFKMPVQSRKYSYAACIGFLENQLPEKLVPEYRRRLAGYEEYSVREKTAIPIIKSLLGKKARIDVDPTLLLDAESWDEVCDKNIEDTPYILIYYVQKTKKLQKYAIKLRDDYKAKGKDVNIICVPCNTEPEILSGKYDEEFSFDLRPQVGPSQVVSLIKNAECVITNSFHATVFSIVFKKQFVTLLTEDSGKKNIRTTDLLISTGLESREMKENIALMHENISWNEVDEKLEQLKNSSIDYIRRMSNFDE